MKRFIVRQADKDALFRQVPEFAKLDRKPEPQSFECCGDLFYALVQSIISQQLAVRAADAIFSRVESLLGEITPERILAADCQSLRDCGLSGRKVEYLRGIAEARLSGAVDFSALARRSDSEIVDELVKLKGVGVWTAEMLLIFALGRPDVLSRTDLGICRGIMLLTGKEILSESEFEDFRRRCSPYGTLASLCLWQIKDGGLTVKKKE